MKVLLASAGLGAGHDAAAAALAEAVEEAYPGCRTRTVDTMRLMGRGVSSTAIWSYTLGIWPFGPLYQLYFDAVWRSPLLANGVKAAIGWRAGPALERELRCFRPDVVVSTFPMASAGLAWLRRRGRLRLPAVAAIPDFAPNPFWVCPELDLHLVSHPVSLADVRAVSPNARATVTSLPVRVRFSPRGVARPAGRPWTVLATFGGLGLGRPVEIVRAALAADPELHVVALCGRNGRLARRLRALGAGPRLDVRGWVEDVPTILAGVDAVINNAGGASALEALSCGIPLLLADPVPGHGRANAHRMVEAGLAVLCPAPAALTAALRALLADPARLERLAGAAREYSVGRDLAADLKASLRELGVDPVLVEPERFWEDESSA